MVFMNTVAIHRSVASSELSRNSAAVFAAAEQGPIEITRRDGEDFVLAKASDLAKERRAISIAADLVAASLSTSGVNLADRLRGPFPWIEFLAPQSQVRFATEIVDVARACAAVGQFSRLLVVFEAWRSSAETIANGYTPDDELEWLDVPVPVTDPRK
jgi:PHD/YefM family antitoxin component YafN of YafNO toxin-antitoxin module